MTTEQIISYLQANKDLLNLKAIGDAAGFKNLSKVISGQKDGRGYSFSFPDKHRAAVQTVIKRLQQKTPAVDTAGEK